ncbi:MAG: glycosyltransferase family 2 protein [Bacteroidia bacterium]|nr:glycosyltransferase family 2 protein [Bacteroidia bacterium]
MEAILWVVLGFAGIRWIVALGNLLSWPLFSKPDSSDAPLISILIPARNEARNLPVLLAQLDRLSHPNLEILILDDNSEDDTPQILAQWAAQHPRHTTLSGKALPSGWLGKHWACHQLAAAATGAYFLYLDADISFLHPDLPQALYQDSQKKSLALVSLFPEQEMKSLGEKIVVPIMHELLLTLLPLRFIRALPFPSMAAANGQCMFFDGNIYRQQQWHKQVKNVVVEDIAIMRRIKAQKLSGMTYVGGGWIGCRMYQTLGEGIAGFSKNILAGFGGSLIGLNVYLLLISAGWIAVAWLLPWPQVALALLLVLSRRVFTSILAGQSVGWNLLLHPAQIAAMVYIGALSVIKSFSGTTTWKGRNVA